MTNDLIKKIKTASMYDDGMFKSFSWPIEMVTEENIPSSLPLDDELVGAKQLTSYYVQAIR